MKKQILKSMLCLSLSAAMLFGEAGAALAETAAPVEAGQELVEAEVRPETEQAEAADSEAEEARTGAEEADTQAGAEGAGAQAAQAGAEEADVQETEETGTAVEGAESQEDVDAVGAKIVSAYNLADVTGLAYDPVTRVLSWNKVPGANNYRVEICDASGAHLNSFSINSVYANVGEYYGFSADTTYNFKVTARNTTEMYLLAAGVSSDDRKNYEYDGYVSKTVGTVVTYDLYKYPASSNAAQIASVARVSTNKAVSALAQLAYKETTNESLVFTVSPAVLQVGESVEYDYANNPSYKSEGVALYSYSGEVDTVNGAVGDIVIPLSAFTPGDTVYIRARVYNPNYDYDSMQGQTHENRYSEYKEITYQIPASTIDYVSMIVTDSSIRLEPSCHGSVTGYQYQRKNGKKWIDLGQQSDYYTDKGLKADTKYTYRVRGYMYNENTKKTVYTAWKTVSAYTWGSSLNLKGSAASATSVSLKWSKVAKAEGYEIYRVDTSSVYYNVAKDDPEEAFQNATLIKTLKKPKKASYKDKKLTKGMTYTYIVRAYRTVNKNKYYIQNSVSVPLTEVGGIQVVNQYYKADASYVVSWKKMTGISGYKVEKYDSRTGKYEAYRTLKKGAASVTLPKVAVGDKDVTYRIRPYKGTRYYAGQNVTVEAKLPAVKNVKAVKTADGVSVTWSAVAGADYYQVYRAKTDSAVYDKTTKTYSIGSDAKLVYEANYTDTSAGVSLAPVSGGANGYTYSDALDKALNGSSFYDGISAYRTTAIKGTSVVDKTFTIKSLIAKSEDSSYNKNTDPEYNQQYGYYMGRYGSYQKNADGSLKTKDIVMVEGPKAGNEYFYFVLAVARPANGANQNADNTVSVGYTKAAHVVYTAKTAAKAAKLSSVSSKKKESVTVKVKKAKGVSGYAIYRSTKKGKGYVKIGTTTKTSYTDNNVIGGKTYYYKVASYKKTENGTYMYSKLSKQKSVKVKK